MKKIKIFKDNFNDAFTKFHWHWSYISRVIASETNKLSVKLQWVKLDLGIAQFVAGHLYLFKVPKPDLFWVYCLFRFYVRLNPPYEQKNLTFFSVGHDFQPLSSWLFIHQRDIGGKMILVHTTRQTHFIAFKYFTGSLHWISIFEICNKTRALYYFPGAALIDFLGFLIVYHKEVLTNTQ